MEPSDMLEIAAAIVFFIGFFGVITSRSIIKSIVAISLMELAVVVFFLSFGFGEGMRAPIGNDMTNVADPLPQALMITAIIIGVAVTAVNLTMMISLCRQLKTMDWDEVKNTTE